MHGGQVRVPRGSQTQKPQQQPCLGSEGSVQASGSGPPEFATSVDLPGRRFLQVALVAPIFHSPITLSLSPHMLGSSRALSSGAPKTHTSSEKAGPPSQPPAVSVGLVAISTFALFL